MTGVPKAQVIFYQDEGGAAPVLERLKVLLKQDRKGYANCVARIQQLRVQVMNYAAPPQIICVMESMNFGLNTFMFSIASCTFLMVKILQFLLMPLLKILIKCRSLILIGRLGVSVYLRRIQVSILMKRI